MMLNRKPSPAPATCAAKADATRSGRPRNKPASLLMSFPRDGHRNRALARAHQRSRRVVPRNHGWLLRRPLLFDQKGLIGQLHSILQRGARAPSEPGEAADVEQFARRAVRP